MPRNRDGVKVLFVELPEGLLYRLHAVAKLSHRSVTGQTMVAVEEHLEKYETEASRRLARQLAEEGDQEGEKRTHKGEAGKNAAGDKPPRRSAKKGKQGT